MAAITAQLVKELRERTGAGMSDCKKALEATGGDLDKAAGKLRMDGSAKADKKAGRTAAEGVIALAQSASEIALVEVNCETDFVAKDKEFRALAQRAAELVLKHKPASVEALGQLGEGESLDTQRRGLVAKIGENMSIRRFEIISKAAGDLVTYIHPGDKIAVVVAMEKGEVERGRELAMHVAAMSPRYLAPSDVSPEHVASERKVIEAQVAQEQAEEAAAGKKPKPAEIIAKMVDGKLRKFASENALLGQPFVRNEAYGLKSDEPVEKVLNLKGAKVSRFVRYGVGDGIEKKKTDFAAEVAAQAGIRA